MRKIYPIAFAVGLMISEPTLADEYMAVPPSGQTEVLFDKDQLATSDALASKCMDSGWKVISSTSTVIVCEAPLNTGQSVLSQLLLGNSYSTSPKRYIRFNVATLKGVSRVQASGWVETQMLSGQVQRADFSGAEFHNNMLSFMVAAGGRFPPGTAFPNHAYLGIDFDENHTGDGVSVARVYPQSEAEAAGVVAGDVISRLAGKRIKSANDWWDAVASAAKRDVYDVEVTRAGKKIRLSVKTAFRPAVAEPTPSAMDQEILQEAIGASAPPAATPPATASIADEILKFSKLRDQGVITDEEFERQKARLLEN